ncbi:Reverse transcriptase (RNA-dependent DNA polymerase) [Popillia japonica]|uniref:Reverse transcriptase (RNA-dependent DNA polymerase) n=1 Tax=Popillia japonica TaxID=7064 RepID=A0AAW1N122_POPJA
MRYEKLDSKDVAAGLFFDLSKPFDIVNHEITLNKLQSASIRGTAYTLFWSYLSGRTTRVALEAEVGGTDRTFISAPDDVSCTIPQGSILGPTLFLH